jgi:hypothetical protein
VNVEQRAVDPADGIPEPNAATAGKKMPAVANRFFVFLR